ncbi:MAG: hypothetical protein ACYTFV_03200 [Planctomycetota bacterium]|jgi:hypothetical protein
MTDWTETLCDHHGRLRAERPQDAMLVVFDVAQLPDGGRWRGLPLIEAWRWFRRRDVEGEAGAWRRLQEHAAAHGLRVPAERFRFGAEAGSLESGCVAVVCDEELATSGSEGPLFLSGVSSLARPSRRGVPELSWEGVATAEDRDAFLGSTVRWCDLPVRAGGPQGVELATCDDDVPVDLEELIGVFAQVGKGARFELRGDSSVVSRLIRILVQSGFPQAQTRLLVSADELGPERLSELAAALPAVSLECSLDFIGPLLRVDEVQARTIVERLRQLGVQRGVIRAGVPERERLIATLIGWGLEVDARHVGGLADVLALSDTGIRSIATDFGLSCRPTLRHEVDAAMGQSPPVSRARLRSTPSRLAASARSAAAR